MASAYIVRRPAKNGNTRFHVRYRTGGREATPQHGGSFSTLKEARARQAWIENELANMRMPQFRIVEPERPQALRAVAERWRASRIDVSERTARNHHVDLARVLPTLGDRAPSEIAPADVAQLVADLHTKGLKRETIRKTLKTLAMVFDFLGVTPNPARDKSVKLPHEDPLIVCPPTAGHVEAVYHLLPKLYRLPMLALDATGMRVGELEALTWGDLDETETRWRVTAAASKTRYARWIPVDRTVFAAVVELVPREDRDLSAQVFAGFGVDRFRTALGKACKAAGVPVFSPHDLRHRRATLWHLSGRPAAEAAAWLGHSPQEHLRTYAHATLVDRSELDYADLRRHHRDTTGPRSPASLTPATLGFKPSRRSRATL